MRHFILKSINIILILLIIFAPLRFDFFYIKKYINADYDYLEITEDTVWNSNTNLSDYEEVEITNNATLTIEPGSQLAIPNITVFEGKIVAQSTIDNKITLKSKEINLEEIAQELNIQNIDDYDRECFDEGPTITFGFVRI